MGQYPAGADEISEATFYGDFTNNSYEDYQKALISGSGGRNDLDDADNKSNAEAEHMSDATGQAILSWLQSILAPGLGALVNGGGTGS